MTLNIEHQKADKTIAGKNYYTNRLILEMDNKELVLEDIAKGLRALVIFFEDDRLKEVVKNYRKIFDSLNNIEEKDI